MENNIFRQEAFDHANERWVGRALLIFSVPLWLVTSLTLILLASLVFLLVKGAYTSRINVVGEVTTLPHPISMFAPERGSVIEVLVKQGQHIKRDMPLYKIEVGRMTSSGSVSAQSIMAIKSQIEESDHILATLQENKKRTIENIHEQIARYDKIYRETKQIAQQTSAGLSDIRRDSDLYEKYFKQGLIAREQVINQNMRLYSQAAQYQSLSSQSMQQLLQIENLKSDLTIKSADFDSQIAQQQSQRSSLMRQLVQEEASSQVVITAPVDGTIDSLSLTPGQMVSAGDSLLQILPEHIDAYRLVVWVPNSAVVYLHPGDTFNVRYDAFSYQKFGQFPAKIESVSAIPVSQQELAMYHNAPAIQEQRESLYKVTAIPEKNSFFYEGKTLMLSNGLRAESTVFLEKRKLYEWMFSPFYNIKNSTSGPINER